MSVTASAGAPPSKPRSSSDQGKKRRHKMFMTASAAAAIAAILFLAIHGFRYYVLPLAARAASPQNAELRPSGTLGRALGITGGSLLLLMYLYPLRKRWKWLARKGKTKHWMDYHILMGLTAPAILTFHSAFKLRGVAGAAYWLMIAVVLSGIIGRYLYGRIPRKLGEAEMGLEEMEKIRADLTAQLEAQSVLAREDLAPLIALPPMDKVQSMPLLRALGWMIALDIKRAYEGLRLRLRAASHVSSNADLRRALALARKQAALSKDILFLSKLKELFHLWHVVHRPFSYSLALLAALHVIVVTFLGY